MEDRKRRTVTSRNNQYYILTALCTSAQYFVQPVPQRHSLWFNQNSKHKVLDSNSTPTSQSWVKLTLALPPPIPRSYQYSTTQSCVNLYSHHEVQGQPVLQHTAQGQPVLPPHNLGSNQYSNTQPRVNQ